MAQAIEKNHFFGRFIAYSLFVCAMVSPLLAYSPSALAAVGDCSRETSVNDPNDLVMCEPWESNTWYSDNNFSNSGGLTMRPVDPNLPSTMLDGTIISNGCKSGNCLRVRAGQYINNSLNVYWPLSNAQMQPDQLYFRYYLKLGSNWDAQQCYSNGTVNWPPSGKFPGFADLGPWSCQVCTLMNSGGRFCEACGTRR